MFIASGTTSHKPIIAIHGGAGDYAKRTKLLEDRRNAIKMIIAEAWPVLLNGASAMKVAETAILALEASELFNAGYGSVIQSDGQARLTASVMNGAIQKFSGVMLATHIIHPSTLAFALQNKEQTVLGPLGVQLLARELGMPPANPVSPLRAEQWAEHIKQHAGGEGGHGTVGVVIRDLSGKLVATTSTGGWTSNVPERVSDVATVAGNYASEYAAVSCTGIGEQIVNDAIAARIETRVRDGNTVIEASSRCLRETENRQREYGWISLDHHGNWALCCTEDMPCAVQVTELSEPVIGQ